MRENANRLDRNASQTAPESSRERPAVGVTEALHLRNYDHRWGYDLAIEAVDPDGAVAFEKRYYLQPGQAESEVGVLPAGEYVVRATLDNRQRDALRCRIDEALAHTAVVEVGNGALSLTAGLLG